MKHHIEKFLNERFPVTPLLAASMSYSLAEYMRSPEFSALYAQRTHPLPDLGLGTEVNFLWSKAMSALTDAMAAAITTLKASSSAGGPTTDQITAQIHTVVDPQVAALTASIATITSSEASDASQIADIQAALAEFTTAFAPASTPAPAPAPAPAPTPAPAA